MANSLSAKKRLRQNEKQHLRNQMRKTRCKNSRKDFMAAVENNDISRAEEALRICSSVYDKAAKKNSISKERADRTKGRLSKMLASMKSGS